MMEDLRNYCMQIHSILSIIVDKDSQNVQSPRIMDCRFGKSNHSDIHTCFIPRITNELPEKLYDFLPTVPI